MSCYSPHYCSFHHLHPGLFTFLASALILDYVLTSEDLELGDSNEKEYSTFVVLGLIPIILKHGIFVADQNARKCALPCVCLDYLLGTWYYLRYSLLNFLSLTFLTLSWNLEPILIGDPNPLVKFPTRSLGALQNTKQPDLSLFAIWSLLYKHDFKPQGLEMIWFNVYLESYPNPSF